MPSQHLYVKNVASPLPSVESEGSAKEDENRLHSTKGPKRDLSIIKFPNHLVTFTLTVNRICMPSLKLLQADFEAFIMGYGFDQFTIANSNQMREVINIVCHQVMSRVGQNATDRN